MSAERPLELLLLEDSLLDAQLVEACLEQTGLRFTLTRVESAAGFGEALSTRRFDVILSDYKLPGFDGAAALTMAQRICPDTPFLFVSGALGEERVVELRRRGAAGCVLKDRLEELAPSIGRALSAGREPQG